MIHDDRRVQMDHLVNVAGLMTVTKSKMQKRVSRQPMKWEIVEFPQVELPPFRAETDGSNRLQVFRMLNIVSEAVWIAH